MIENVEANEQRFEQLSKGCLSAAFLGCKFGRKFRRDGDRLSVSRVALGLARVRERSGIGVSA